MPQSQNKNIPMQINIPELIHNLRKMDFKKL